MIRKSLLKIVCVCGLIATGASISGQEKGHRYYFSTIHGDDSNNGTEASCPFFSLEKAGTLHLVPGDTLFLEKGSRFEGSLQLSGVKGSQENPVVITSYGSHPEKPFIDAAGCIAGVHMLDCGGVTVRGLHIEADGNGGNLQDPARKGGRRYGVFCHALSDGYASDILLEDLDIRNIYMEEKGFTRPEGEVNTPHGLGMYGFGICVRNSKKKGPVTNVVLDGCHVSKVSHTGIQFYGLIMNSEVKESRVEHVGGPGIHMTRIRKVHVHHNVIDHSGCGDDSRNRHRGSGFWCWGAYQVLLEHNRLTNAFGPNDSFGCHIDYNCSHVIYQYNFSADNYGGFCEILGENHNCCYRYNVSVNDGWRQRNMKKKVVNGFSVFISNFSKTFSGPYNTYVYNNTIYTDENHQSNVQFAGTTKGICLVNNIFCTRRGTQGNISKRGNKEEIATGIERVVMNNNLFLTAENGWPTPEECMVQDGNPYFGDPEFIYPGGMDIADYTPQNRRLVRNGAVPRMIPGDEEGLWLGLRVDQDILGRKIGRKPCMGAIYVR